MSRLRQAVADAAAVLARAGIDSARVDAELLAAHIAGVARGGLLFGDPDEAFYDRYHVAIAARARRIPLQHITGSAAFGSVTLTVGPGVFIPRPETEAVLEWALRQDVGPTPVIVDLCTGSGALAVALAQARPAARVVAVENASAALTYARRNAAGYGVEVIEADVCAPDVLADHYGHVDLVVTNPPYIPDGAELDPEVAEHDPAAALFGGPDGMQIIRPIVALAARLLRPGGLIALEHDDDTAAATVAAFGASGAFTEVVSRRDLAGRPRFVTARAQRSG
jgi:release factor glutamine methyltransferase